MKFIYPPLPPVGSATIGGYDANTVLAFCEAYVLSLPPQVQALHVGEYGQIQVNDDTSQVPTVELDPAVRLKMATDLAKQGFFIDAWLDAYSGMNPYILNTIRLFEGVTSIESALGTATKPVSANIADYPPFTPAPPPPTPTQDMVGDLEFNNIYKLTPLAMSLFNAGQLKNGQTLTENGHAYTFEVVTLVVGFGYFWVRNS